MVGTALNSVDGLLDNVAVGLFRGVLCLVGGRVEGPHERVGEVLRLSCRQREASNDENLEKILIEQPKQEIYNTLLRIARPLFCI